MKLGLFGVLAGLLSPQVNAATHIEKPDQAYVPGEVVIQYESSLGGLHTNDYVLGQLIQTFGYQNIQGIELFQTTSDMALLQLADDALTQQAMSHLEMIPEVKRAEPNYIYHAMVAEEGPLPNDPQFDKQWGLYNEGQPAPGGSEGEAGADISIVDLWEEGHVGNHDVVMAVIDTGVEWDHPDIKANLYTNPNEKMDGEDTDGNGFVDDVHGWNFEGDSNDSNDDNNHGTHVAGIAGALGNDGVGIAGVAWDVQIMPIKFLSASGGGTLKDALESIRYATLMGVDIMNNSWGGGGHSDTMKEAIEEAEEEGILFVASAGNSRRDNDRWPAYPASYDVDNVLSVAATDNQDELAWFSNYGKERVHVAAPGVAIQSCIINGEYDALSGTSMSAPMVAGVAAVMMGGNPDMDYQEVKDRLIRTSDPVPELADSSVSGGRVNAYQAYHNIVPEPPEDGDEGDDEEDDPNDE